MDKRLWAAGWIFVVGIFVMVVGAIHCAVTPLILKPIRYQMGPADVKVFLFMYLGTGVATIFAGWLIVKASEGLKRNEAWAWNLSWWATWFITLLGIGASLLMMSNPFAHITLALAVLLIAPLFWYGPYIRPHRF